MKNNVTVIGFKNSGKTTYLAGMYTIMSAGRKNFSLVTKDPDLDLFLENLWDGICSGNFPLPSDKDEIFSFHLAHNYKPVCDFDWLDYPGGILADPNHPSREKLNTSIREAACLILVLDGDLFAIDATSEADYEAKLTQKLEFDSGLRKETKALTRLSAEGIVIPPICIVVTKCDKINFDYQAAVEKVLRESLKGVFEGNPLVMVSSVSFGEGIDHGAAPDPYCIEQPIAFAVLVILLKYLKALKISRTDNKEFVNKSRDIISRWWNSAKISAAENNIKELAGVSDKWSEDAYKLLELFPDKKKIYINGKEEKFKPYFRDIFCELGK
ncbi:hypothetical protein [Anaeromicropila populeti]|uniref:Uncharacterized protein n=1 Tax=Anaeromicropila populeti TaxID=37658 RepID=A0A1I6KLK2_9FIRM|nr:hypothetical protein [Anaeromicropila populeti]SFR92142.1 hypothetical protein SAMN05661086_02520 [Anaeromicropila populeti]